ncbi:MAG TPA: hypothetical protein VNA88_01640 [Candidatus Kapabacteria bacterium]|jgi:hypothetical protein|nr:hypothetical protein [Candidatus Kapabacteria bacterium]
MILRAFLAWLVIVVLAIMNGTIRQALLLPMMGETAARAVSTIVLSAVVVVMTMIALPRIRPASRGEAWQIGALWLVLTLAFEFLVGHYVFGNPWSKLLADYDIGAGRIWVLALIVTLCAPAVLYGWRRSAA